MLLGVDVGGTFTDAALLDGDALHTAKVPSTPDDQSRGVIAAVEEVLRRAGAEPARVEGFTHGMTVGTNALLEERGARTALVATAGLADVLEIGRQNRPTLYHPCRGRPSPLVDSELRFEAEERIGPDGVVTELADEEVARLVAELGDSGAESIAVCLLFAFADRAHERRIAEALREALPGVHISASHEVLPAFREYERFSTTVIDAYLSPLLGRYLTRLASACEERGLPVPEVMRSSGGTAEAPRAARSARASWRAPPATPTRSASTWEALPATSAWSTPARCGAPTRARSRAARSSCRWSTSIPWVRAAVRLPGAMPVARCASGRAPRERSRDPPATAAEGRSPPSPTPTCCSANSPRIPIWQEA